MGVAFIRRLTVPQRLEASAAVVYGLVFVLLVLFGRPGLGLSQGFYLAIVLVGLAGGAWTGAAAGVVAAALLVASELVARTATFATVWGAGLEIRLGSYVVAGAAVGYFAQRGRRMLSESLRVLDDLLRLARREVESGALTSGGFESRVAERISRPWPFAVLAGGLAVSSDKELRAGLGAIAAALGDGDDVARVGDKVAVVASSETAGAARLRAFEIERALERAGITATFGWAFYPQDGADALALFGAASERLQARRHALGEDTPAAVVTELRSRPA